MSVVKKAYFAKMSKAILIKLDAESNNQDSERNSATPFRSLMDILAPPKIRFAINIFILIIISVSINNSLYAQSENSKNEQSWKFSFDQPQTVWRIETDEPNLKTIEHKYSPQEGYGKRGCEYISLQIPARANSIMVGMKVGTGLLSDDVLPTIYVKSNQTGLRFMLRVILPMTPDDSQSNKQGEGKSSPLAILLAGGTYSLNGSWQQIRIDRPLDLLKNEAIKISQRSGKNIDVTNAYYDMAYLDINGGEGELNLWIDDLEINGYVPVSPEEFVKGSLRTINQQNRPNSSTPPAGNNNYHTNELSGLDANTGSQTPVVPANRLKSQMKNNSIYVNDSLFFIRAIRYRGEPLEYLRQLGFNTIWMDTVPTEGQMIQAQELGLWIISPPPLNKQQWDVFSGEATNFTPTFWGDRYNRVIAWNLGNLTRNSISVEHTNRLCRRIRECDREILRPIIAQADENMLNYSRQVQSLIIERNPIYSSLDMKKYLRWHRDIPCLVQAGMPRICVIQTQPDAKLTQVWKTMFPNETFPESIPYEQLQATAFAAAGSGVRGLFFDSQTSLFSNDPDAQYRSRSLELLNSRLSAADSFFVAGTPSMPVNASDPNLWYIILTVANKGRLALPLYIPKYAQYSLSGSFTRSVSAAFEDIPTTYQAYRFTPNGLEPLKTNRLTGDMNVIIDSQADWSIILFAQNPSVISSLYNRLKIQGNRPSVLFHELTTNRLENFRPWFNPQRASKEELSLFNSAVKALEYSNRLINQNLLSEADSFSCDAANALRILEYSYWSGIIGTRQEPVFHPAAVSFRTMRLYFAWRQNMQNYRQGDNVLPAGDLESVVEFQKSKWALFLDLESNPYISAKGDINPMAAYSGTSGLCLTVQTAPELQNSIALLDKAPITVQSPIVHLEPFELVKITCLVNLPEKKAIKGSVDGLKIYDVYTGDILARRITETHGWQTIVMFRTADSAGNIQLRFELTGIGKAYIDNVKIIRIVPGSGGNLVE